MAATAPACRSRVRTPRRLRRSASAPRRPRIRRRCGSADRHSIRRRTWLPERLPTPCSGTPAKPAPIRRAAPRSRASTSRSRCSMARVPTSRRFAIAAERRGVCGGHDQCQQSEFERADQRAQSAHSASNLAPQTGQQSIQDIQAEFAGAQTRGQGDDRPADPAQGNGADHARLDRGRIDRTRWRPRSWRCRPACRRRIRPPRCCTRPTC